MSKDMKLIMEAWNSYVNEQYAVQAMMAQGQAKASFSHIWEDLFQFAVEIFDPTGYSSWDDLERSWDHYIKNMDTKDPYTLQGFSDATFVMFDFIDSIPWLGLLAKPITLPLHGYRALRKMSQTARKAGMDEIADAAIASSDKLLRKYRGKVFKLGWDKATSNYGKILGNNIRKKLTKPGSDLIIKTFPFLNKLPNVTATKAVILVLATNLSNAIYSVFFQMHKTGSVPMGKVFESALRDELDKKWEQIKSDKEFQDGINHLWSLHVREADLKGDDPIYETKEEYVDGVMKEQFYNSDLSPVAKEVERAIRELFSTEVYGDFEMNAGHLISRKGDYEAALRAAERTIERNAQIYEEKVENIINDALSKEKEAEDKEKKSKTNSYDDTPQSIPGRFQI